jgi:tagaturonate reductase
MLLRRSHFPGSCLHFLYHRFRILKAIRKGMVIIPTELIPDNGDKLLSVLLETAHQNGWRFLSIGWKMPIIFAIHWWTELCPASFPTAEEEEKWKSCSAIHDGLMIMSEVYALVGDRIAQMKK